ncbi:MAG: hypothetical protein H7331_11500 [Bacteroidia bacterium]|nr:hypothetical protein [Bacteroidia bacterium]
MKTTLLTIALATTTFVGKAQAQTWTKVSGIMDSSQVKGIAVNNNQIVAAGQN